MGQQTSAEQPLQKKEASLKEPPKLVPTSKDSNAADPQKVAPGYKATNVQTSKNGVTALLSIAGNPCNVYGVDIDKLQLTVSYDNPQRLRIQIEPDGLTSETEKYYRLPPNTLPDGRDSVVKFGGESELLFEYCNEPTFWFVVSRRDTKEVIFTTKYTQLVFENQFIEFKTCLPVGHNVFGIGETIDDFKIKPGTVRTLHNADIPDKPGANLYGSHPVYLEERYDKRSSTVNSHMVYLRNAHSQEIIVGESELCWRTIGGTIDLYIFSGPRAVDAIAQYQKVVGLPAMQQYWTLGHHHSRWGIVSTEEFLEIVENYQWHDIPLEAMWSDLDYMDEKKNFTLYSGKYGDFADGLTKLHDYGMKYVPLVDAAVYCPPDREKSGYRTFIEGDKDQVFVKDKTGSKYYVGEVWPGPTVYPDWFNENTSKWWAKELEEFRKLVNYDGLWLDMNEASSFCTQKNEYFSERSDDPIHRNLNYPPYVLNNATEPNELGGRTIPMDASYSNGYAEYDCHNLWGYEEAKTTYDAMINRIYPNKRPFIITRSTFAGSGSFAGHWGGDNFSQWEYLKYSISQGLSFSIFGVPMFGPDTCGFIGDADDELCIRWCQLSGLFSFFRNHNIENQRRQEFYRSRTLAENARYILKTRYELLPYMYTRLYKASSEGETYMRAVSWEFPNQKSLVGLDTQFMIGPAIMIAPVLESGQRSVDVIFPKSTRWYNWYDYCVVDTAVTSVDAPLSQIPLYIRGGSILTLQKPGLTTNECRNGTWTVLVALDDSGNAEGELYLDDGVSIRQKKSSFITFVARASKLSWETVDEYKTEKLVKVIIMGISQVPRSVEVNGSEVTTFTHDQSGTLFVDVSLSDWIKHGEIEWVHA